MNALLPPPSGPGTDLASRGNLLAPVIRRDIADLNRQYLMLNQEPQLAEDPRFRLSPALQSKLSGCSAEARERLTQCPFSLFQLHLPDAAESASLAAGRIADTRGEQALDAAAAARCHVFTLLSISVARQIAETLPLSPRIALGVSAATESRLAGMRPSELAQVAAWPGLIRPRWPRHERYWGMLIAASQVSDPGALRRAYCVGLCLLTGAGACAVTAAAPPTRPRRHPPRGGRGRGVPC